MGGGELVVEAGLSDRVDRRLMEFDEGGASVDGADVVVLNRVICCYPDMPKLAGAAADRAKAMLVMSFPNRRWWTRFGLTLANFGFRVIRLQFLVFLHQPALILAAVEERGFKTRLHQQGLLWHVGVAAWRCPCGTTWRRSTAPILGVCASPSPSSPTACASASPVFSWLQTKS